MAVTDEFIADVAEALDTLGYAVENEEDVIDDVSEINDDVTLPGIRSSGGILNGYVSMKLAVLKTYLDNLYSAITTEWRNWFGSTTSTGVQGEWQALKTDIQTATSSASSAASSANSAANSASMAATNANEKAELANTAATNADTARTTIEANESSRQSNEQTRQSNEQSRVSAESARVTQASNDHTTATSDHTASVSATNAANTAAGRVETAITTANQDHTRAENDHTTASSDHTTASSDHTTATSDHTASTTATTAATTQANRAKEWSDHPPYIGNGTNGDLNYWYLWDEANDTYVRGAYAKGDDLDWDTMTPAEKEALAQEVLSRIGFDDVPTQGSDKAVKSSGIYNALQGKQDTITIATDAVCEEIVDELTA